MAQLIIDLSAPGGLAPRFFGYRDQSSSTPARRYTNQEGTLSEGFFNPWMRPGFLSPAVGTLGAMTTNQAFDDLLVAYSYDQPNDDIYVAEKGHRLYRLDGLDDTSFEQEVTLDGTTGTPQFTDTEIYQKAGIRTLFVAYRRTGDTFTANAGTNEITSSNITFLNGTAVTLTTTVTLPAGLSLATTYYIVEASSSVAKLSLTLGGAAIDITDAGTGTHTLVGGFGDMLTKVLTSGGATDREIMPNATNGTKLSGNGEILLRVADNGFMYIFDNNTVHKYDGTVAGGASGTLSANVLLFPSYFTVMDAIDYRGLMFIGISQLPITSSTIHNNLANHEINSGIYIWDRLSSVIQTRDYVPLAGVKVIKRIYVAPNGSLRLLCIAASGLTQMREYNGSTFVVIKELGLGACPQYVDGLCTTDQHSVWLGNDGAIYGHGAIDVGGPDVLAKIGQVKVTSTSTPATTLTGAGMVMFGAANGFSSDSGYRADRMGFTISYNDGGSKLAKKWFPFDKGTINSNAQNALQGDIFTSLFFLPTMSTITTMDVYMATGTTSGSTTQATIKIYFNGSTTAWASKTVTRDDVVKGYKHIEINKPFINTIQVEIEYSVSASLADSIDFHPAFAVVEYEPTGAKG